MSRVIWLCLVLAAVLRCPVAGQTAQPTNWTTLFRDDFEDGIADGWAVSVWQDGAGWEVVRDGGNWVFSGKGHSTADWLAGRWPDFRFKARVKMIRGGLFVSYRTGSCDRYFLSFGPGPLVLNRSFPCGTSYTVLNVAASHSLGRWYTLEVVGAGANLKVYIDGARQIDFTDPSPNLFGGVALEANPESQVYVDDVEISGPPPPAITEQLVWSKTGGPPGGMGHDIRMSPGNPDTIYAADLLGGVFVSRDGGRNWRKPSRGMPESGILSLALDKANPAVAWAGTFSSGRILRTEDGGENWRLVGAGGVGRVPLAIHGITLDPGNPNVAYAACGIPSRSWAGEVRTCRDGSDMTRGAIYRTVNGGGSWELLWEGEAVARRVWIDRRNSNVLFTSTGWFDTGSANCDPGGVRRGGVGVLKSTDGGKSWKTIGRAEGLPSLRIGALVVHPSNPDVLLAGGGDGSGMGDGGVFLSLDGGEKWTTVLATDDEEILAVEYAPSDARVLYAAGSSVYRSEDGGGTWRKVNGPLWGPPGTWAGGPNDIEVDPRNAYRLFINGFRGGIYLSEDGGESWRSGGAGSTSAEVHGVAVDSGDPELLFASGRSGLFRSRDGGGHWEGLNYPPATFQEGSSVSVDPADSRNLLASDDGTATIYRSTDGGRTWRVVLKDPRVDPRAGVWAGHSLRVIRFAASDPRVVYAGACTSASAQTGGGIGSSFGLFKSGNSGESFQEANDERTAKLCIMDLAASPTNPEVIFAASQSAGVLRSTNGGMSWSPANSGLPRLDVRALAADPLNSATLYAGLENGGLHKSLNAGDSWQAASYGMDPQGSVRDIVIDPTNPQVLYASGFQSGIYRSEDAGRSWAPVNRGMSTRSVTSLAFSSDASTLYAATNGEGVYRLDLRSRSESVVAVVSAASFAKDSVLAAESVASVFGHGLAATSQTATATPLPTRLSEASVAFTDSSGADYNVGLFFAAPGQINCLIPPNVKSGDALVRVFRQGKVVARGPVKIETVAPGLFTANADGKGAPAAVAQRFAADGSQTQVPVFHCGATCTPAAIDLGAESDQVILLLFGTGIRNGKQVSVRIGGVEAPVLGAAAQGQYAGLDQVNVRLPRALIGRGEVDLVLTVDGKAANVVKVRVL